MDSLKVNPERLRDFENGLDPLHPDRHPGRTTPAATTSAAEPVAVDRPA